jgi:hypothetical protein
MGRRAIVWRVDVAMNHANDMPVVVTAAPPGIAETALFGPIGESDELPEFFPADDHDPLEDQVDDDVNSYLLGLIDDDDEERDDEAMLALLAELGVDLGPPDELEKPSAADGRDRQLLAVIDVVEEGGPEMSADPSTL